MWGQPNSLFLSFQKDLLGKCDVCFRAGFCSITECDAQNAMEKTVIDNIVNSSQLHGLIDSSVMSKLVKNIVNDKKVDFKKYEKIIRRQIKNAKNPKKFNKILAKMSNSLKLLSEAKNKIEFKDAIKNVQKALIKVKSSETIKNNIQKIAESFKNLTDEQEKQKTSNELF